MAIYVRCEICGKLLGPFHPDEFKDTKPPRRRYLCEECRRLVKRLAIERGSSPEFVIKQLKNLKV